MENIGNEKLFQDRVPYLPIRATTFCDDTLSTEMGNCPYLIENGKNGADVTVIRTYARTIVIARNSIKMSWVMTEAQCDCHNRNCDFYCQYYFVALVAIVQHRINGTASTFSHFVRFCAYLFMYDKCLIFLKPSRKQKHGNYECLRAFSSKHEKVQHIFTYGRGWWDVVAFQV